MADRLLQSTFPEPETHGFTLIELLVSLMAMGLILSAAYTTLFSGLGSYRASVNESEVLTVLGRSLDRIYSDLSSAFVAEKGTRFVIEDDTEEDENFGEISIDRLWFQSRIGKVVWDDTPRDDRTEVEYFIDLDEDTPPRWLVRRTQSPADDELETGGVIHLVGPRVLGMEIEAFDGTKWVAEWDSTSKLPYSVRVTLFMVPSIPIEEPARLQSLSATFWIPTAGQAGGGSLIATEESAIGEETEETEESGEATTASDSPEAEE